MWARVRQWAQVGHAATAGVGLAAVVCAPVCASVGAGIACAVAAGVWIGANLRYPRA